MYKLHRSAHSRLGNRPASTTITAIWQGSRSDRCRIAAFLAFLLLLLLGGGASRTDVLSVIYVRPAAVLCIGILAALSRGGRCEGKHLPVRALLLLAACVAVQLIPLPPAIWTALPGHARYGEAAALLGIAQPWRPISIAPDLTLNSLLALLPVLATALGTLAIRPDQRRVLAPLLIAAALFSAGCGVLQVAQGQGYFYLNRSPDVADGIFANRNHQAVFLAVALVLLGSWPALTLRRPSELVPRAVAAGCASLFLFMMIVATGSRSGLLLGAAAGLFATLTFVRGVAPGRGRRLSFLALPVAAVLALAAMVLGGRAASLDRLLGVDLAGEQRLSSLPTLVRLLRDYLPMGSGFGTFDPVFRTAEPDALLHYGYFNHAHNDAIELVLTGGVPAAVLGMTVLGWWVWASWRVFAVPGRAPEILLGRAGSATMALLGAASLSDYPLRTPLLGGLFVIAACWLHAAVSGRAAGRGPSVSCDNEAMPVDGVAFS